ncbi:MAG: serine/threonine-protein kinase, partial [Planctomycetota bacterium]
MPICPDCFRDYPDDMTSCPHCGKLELDATVTTPHDEYGSPLPGGAESVQISPGMILAEQYKVLQRIGSGGMGEVWKAMDMELETIVAIKVLPPELARNPLSVRRLRREAMIGQRLAHPAICRLYGFHSQSDIKFIVMEYVEGKTLQQLLAARLDDRASWDQVKSILRQVALALDFAHRVAYQDSFGHDVRGVLHRDIKPSNIMVTSRGQARLMDFGIASEIHSTMTHLTGNSSLTPLYASPEQFRGDSLTPASDIYSFSTVVYQCLSGHRYVQPHGDLRYQVLEKPYRPIEQVPEAVNRLLEKGLAKSPDDRPGTARELIDRLDEAVAQPDEPAAVDDEAGATSAPPAPASSPRPTEAARRAVPMADQVLGRPVHAFPTRAVLAGLGGLVALVVLVVVLASMGGDRSEPPRQVSAAELDELKRTADKLVERVEQVDPADGLGMRVLALEPLRRRAEQSPEDIQEAWRRYSLLVDRAREVLALDEARRAARDARPAAEKAMQAARETGLEQG